MQISRWRRGWLQLGVREEDGNGSRGGVYIGEETWSRGRIGRSWSREVRDSVGGDALRGLREEEEEDAGPRCQRVRELGRGAGDGAIAVWARRWLAGPERPGGPERPVGPGREVGVR